MKDEEVKVEEREEIYLLRCFQFIITDKSKGWEGRREGVGVMKDDEVNLEEIESSHTLGTVGRSYSTVIHT
jgi:hypothetical protein